MYKNAGQFKIPEKISHITRLYNMLLHKRGLGEKKAGHNINVSVLGKTLINGKKLNQKKSTSLDLILRLEIL